MPIWTYTKGPKMPWVRESAATNKGWMSPLSKMKEVLVCIGNLNTRKGTSNVAAVSFDKLSYLQGGLVSIIVRYDEYVNVVAGANLNLSWTGVNGDFKAYALAQTNVNNVVFNVDVANAPLHIFTEPGTLFISAQSIIGTIHDADGAVSKLTISAPIAAAAGTRVVV